MKLPKEMRTKGGLRVINLEYKPLNSVGNEVTFPIKGTIIIREKPRKTEYNIWRKDGRLSIFKETKKDLDI